MSKMNPEVKSKLCYELRNGGHKQVKNNLSCNGGHCALGVACEMALRAGIVTKTPLTAEEGPDEKGLYGYTDKVNRFAYTCYPPEAVGQWLGLDDAQMLNLFVLNDQEGKTFAEIADYIEAEY